MIHFWLFFCQNHLVYILIYKGKSSKFWLVINTPKKSILQNQKKRHVKLEISFSKTPSKSSKKFFFISFYMFLLIFVWKLQKILVTGFRYNLGCAPRPKLDIFSKFLKVHIFCHFITQIVRKTSTMVFIWGDRGYPAVRFEYKTASCCWDISKTVLGVFKKIQKLNVFEKHP